MELAFDSKSIRTLCESATHAEVQFGPAAAEALRRRLADLRAAVSLDDLLVTPARLLRNDDSSVMIVDFCAGHQLVLCVNHPKPPKMPNGSIDWANVCRIKLLRIERHDS